MRATESGNFKEANKLEGFIFDWEWMQNNFYKKNLVCAKWSWHWQVVVPLAVTSNRYCKWAINYAEKKSRLLCRLDTDDETAALSWYYLSGKEWGKG